MYRHIWILWLSESFLETQQSNMQEDDDCSGANNDDGLFSILGCVKERESNN